VVSVDDDLGYFVGVKAALLACENLEEALTRESVISPELWRNIAGVRACVRVVSDLIDQRDKMVELPGTDLPACGCGLREPTRHVRLRLGLVARSRRAALPRVRPRERVGEPAVALNDKRRVACKEYQ